MLVGVLGVVWATRHGVLAVCVICCLQVPQARLLGCPPMVLLVGRRCAGRFVDDFFLTIHHAGYDTDDASGIFDGKGCPSWQGVYAGGND